MNRGIANLKMIVMKINRTTTATVMATDHSKAPCAVIFVMAHTAVMGAGIMMRMTMAR